MEKPKKKLSKKSVIICSVILAVVLAVGGAVGVIIHKNSLPINPDKIYTFDEVTMGLSKKISYAVDKESVLTQEEINEIWDRYKSVKFVTAEVDEWYGLGDVTSHLLFYDKNDKLLFEIYETRYSFITITYKSSFYDFQMIN